MQSLADYPVPTTEAERAFLLAVRRDLVRALAEIEKRLGLAARHCTDCPLRR